jgi:hypothetical protein
MTKKRNPAKAAPPKLRAWRDEVRAQNEIVGRLSVELGIDQAELFRRARERLREACQQLQSERGRQPERGDT